MVSEAVSKTESSLPVTPRISFSADLSDEGDGDFICISGQALCKETVDKKDVLVKGSTKVSDFEFLSENATQQRMLTADELFSEGKFLPFRQVTNSEKLKTINITKNNKDEDQEEERKAKVANQESNNRVSWFIDEDPSPRPPNCTVLWKELLRLKKQRNTKTVVASSLSPSSSTSSSSSLEDGGGGREKEGKRERGKKGLERTRSASMRIRPMIHVPICTPSSKSSSVPLPPLFPLKKNRVERKT